MHSHRIADADVSQRPKERIAVRRQHHVSPIARHRGAGQMAGSAGQHAVIGALKYDGREAKTRDFQLAHDLACSGGMR